MQSWVQNLKLEEPTKMKLSTYGRLVIGVAVVTGLAQVTGS